MPIFLILLFLLVQPAAADLSIIGHATVPLLDQATLQRIYTGKTVALNGVRLTPVNFPPNHPLRTQFLRNYLERDENDYTGYWTVRCYVGKGVPPQELHSVTEVLQFIVNTTGAIGYIDDSDLTPEVKVLLKK